MTAHPLTRNTAPRSIIYSEAPRRVPTERIVYGGGFAERNDAPRRVQLRTAYDSFVQMRADSFANRARRD